MSSSFDYQIERMTPEREEEWNRLRGGGPGQCEQYSFRCSGDSRKHPCAERTKWHCSYAYVTGQRGRTTHADRHYCDSHARKFCQSHGLALPSALAELELKP
jgi:hypothetical protein